MRYLKLGQNKDQTLETSDSDLFGVKMDEVEIDEDFYGRLSSGFNWMDPIFGQCFHTGDSGIAKKMTYLVSGAKGVGKSTILRSVMHTLAKDDDNMVFWVSNEERLEFIKLQNKRLGLFNSKVLYDNIQNVDLAIQKASRSIAGHKGVGKNVFPILLVDSLQGMVMEDFDKGKKSLVETQNPKKIVSKFINWSHEVGATVFIICQETTAGTVKGGSDIQHMVDAILRLGFDKKNECRYIISEKNRLGGLTQEKAYYDINERGAYQVSP
jgi:predicted ATP-dependent serine protease